MDNKITKYILCNKCGRKLSRNNKSGFCNTCRDRSGSKNSFYGKHHSEYSKEVIRNKCSEATKSLWLNKEYREKIIIGVSKPRKDSFKKEQSERVKCWYKNNPEQIEIRSLKMKESWKSGKIIYNEYNIKRSKTEIEFFNELEKIVDCKEKRTIKIGNKWYLPDIFVQKDGIIIEYFGDFWHANPNIYKSDDIIHHEFTAQNIWDRDKLRQRELEEFGYRMIIIWESEYLKDRQQTLNSLSNLLNWETCVL